MKMKVRKNIPTNINHTNQQMPYRKIHTALNAALRKIRNFHGRRFKETLSAYTVEEYFFEEMCEVQGLDAHQCCRLADFYAQLCFETHDDERIKQLREQIRKLTPGSLT